MKKRNVIGPHLLKEGKVSDTAGILFVETMPGVYKDVGKVIDAKRAVEDAINDFDMHACMHGQNLR